MRPNYQLIEQLSKATPRKHVIRWIALTLLYGFAIIVNDHFDLIASLGLPGRYEAVVRLCGVYLYIILTAFQFQKTRNHEKYPRHHKVAPDLADHDQHNNVPAPSGTKVRSQRHRTDPQMPDNFFAGK